MPDYMYSLESRLSPEQRAVLVRMQELSTTTTTNVYLVGGAVRDLISGMPIRDLDFAVEGNPFRFVRELEKGGARVVHEDEKLRHAEMLFAGDVDGSIAAAHDDFYVRPGTAPEVRWSTIMEDLRRRDFSINAIALSLNPASRGLLLDPTNGLSDLETQHEVRALSIHSFTNQTVRLLRALRYATRMGFKLETRTQEWFDLALERGLQATISPESAGNELRQAARDDKAAGILKSWESHGLLETISPHLAKRHPDYDALSRLARAKEELMAVGLRPRLTAAGLAGALGKLSTREQASLLHRLKFANAEIQAVEALEGEGKKLQALLAGSKTAAPKDAYALLEKTPLETLGYLLAETSRAPVRNKIRNYTQKWRQMRTELPSAATELETIGMPRGPKFDKVIEDFFSLQLNGKAKTPEDRTRILRKLSGIKEPPPKKIKEVKKKPGGAPAPAAEAKHPSPGAPGGSAAQKAPVHGAPANRIAATAAKGKAGRSAPATPANKSAGKRPAPKKAARR
jgi:tRNA nucleotidyltransferase/poly(A) polymerase